MASSCLCRGCLQCSVLLVSILTCSTSFDIPSKVPDRIRWQLHAHHQPKNNKHVALAKHSLLRVAAAILSVPSNVFTTPPMMEPPPDSYAEHVYRNLVSELLADGWNESPGAAPPVSIIREIDNEADSRNDNGFDPSTYGEVTELGARQLFHYMRMNQDSKDDVVFVDLGSGQGKLVVQAFLEIPWLRSAMGIELVQDRHDAAVQAWNKIQGRAHDLRAALNEQTLFVNEEASVEFLHGDLMAMNVTNATHVYVASLCFSNEMMQRLADKLAREAASIKCVATLRPFPKRSSWTFGTPTVEYVEMSWTKPRDQGCAVYIYR